MSCITCTGETAMVNLVINRFIGNSRKIRSAMIIFMLLIGFFTVFGDVPFGLLAGIYVFAVAFNDLLQEDPEGIRRLRLSLPATRWQVVGCRYLSALIYAVGAQVVFWAWGLGLGLVLDFIAGKDIGQVISVDGFIITMLFTGLFIAVYTPFAMKYPSNRKIVVPVLVILPLIGLLGTLLKQPLLWMILKGIKGMISDCRIALPALRNEIGTLPVLLLLALAILLLEATSATLAWLWYRNKDE